MHTSSHIAPAFSKPFPQRVQDVSFVTSAPHLQAGHEPLFSGSFKHLPLNNWYYSALCRAHERFMQGSVDLEASAR